MVRKASGRNAALLIDGSNLYAAVKNLGFTVDFKKLINSFDGSIHKAYYFTALPPDDQLSTLRPLIDYIEFNGFTVIKKVTKEYDKTSTFRCVECGHEHVTNSTTVKGNMDVEIATVAKEVAPYVDDIYLFSGDGDFRFLVEALQRQHGNYVTVVSTIRTKPMMCADALRRQADAFLELDDMREIISRDEDKRTTARQRFIAS